jgi:Spy/CpxP family protein refolding chaperone
MKPWIRRSLLGVFGVTFALGALTACGHHSGHHGWNASAEDQAKFRGHVLERVASKLDLNEDPKKRLATLADKLQEQRAALRGGAAGDPRAEMQKLVAGDKFDRARAQTLVTEKTAAINTKSPEVIAAMGDFYDSLNPQQQAKVREFMQGHHRGGWWHRG